LIYRLVDSRAAT